MAASFADVRRAEDEYGRKLRKIARHVGELVRSFGPTRLGDVHEALRRYAELLTPWARVTAERMLNDVVHRDTRQWSKLSEEMYKGLLDEIKRAPMGHIFRRLQDEQVSLITSIPREASERVHRLALQARTDAARASELAAEIARTGHVSLGRANTIARTEVGRVATNIARGRAEFVGSPGYKWRTAKDSDVRPSHKKMEGKFVRWDEPPTLDNLTGHAGALPNCRCYPEIVLPGR